jgi:two-component system sensor histidine kinase KdpD
MTSDYRRPNPDELLARVNADEQLEKRGKLKIFLGYVAGVGKTYAMLEAAHQRKEEGVDVVVGYVETHGRKDTEILIEGLEVTPRKLVKYYDVTLSDMDLDAVLARHPELVLVDELAHTNAPSLRHVKRYQDVQEILNAGIDVYSTVNIQHLESLNDVVQQITGVTVRETIPDSLVDQASEIELVDLPADELLQRLRDGKVYVSDQATRALEKFFRKGNLTALRELSLRRAAEQVDNQMLSYMQTRSIPGPWPAGDRILVCISSHPMGERLIRVGRRLADDLNAEWYVMFVETPGHLRMSQSNRERLQQNFYLAEELGAKVVNVTSESVAQSVIEYSRQKNITKIIAGKPLRPRWMDIFRGSVIDQIIRRSGGIDIYVVSEAEENLQRTKTPEWLPRQPWSKYLLAAGLVLLFTLAGLPLHPILYPTNLVMLYLAAVVIVAVYLGRGPAILASFLSVLAFDFTFVDPRFTFTVNDTQYILTFIGLLLVGLVISNLAAILRDQVDILRVRERQAQAINMLSRELTSAITMPQVLTIVVRQVSELFNRDAVILLPENGRLVQQASTPGFQLDQNEYAVADWAFKNKQPAGRGTDTLPAAEIRFMPLVTSRGAVGVLGVRPIDPKKTLTFDQRTLMEGVANLSALAIERASFAEKAAQTEVLRTTEKLQTALLNSISHELRTPLASITGVLSTLGEFDSEVDAQGKLDSATRIELIESATRQAKRLNLLVENLLNMTRLEAGTVQLNREPVDLQELIGSVLYQAQDRITDHPVEVNLPPDLPFVPMDAVLIAQVMNNLLDNACKYSPPKSSIGITVKANTGEDRIEVTVSDHGIGVPPDELDLIFNKFFRSKSQVTTPGTGLGLSICKGVVEAHGGTICARNHSDKGLSVSFILPLHV